ncbi:MAG: PEP-CTERM sorting domain-containing protein [Desulfobulbaceae bacterium]|nr:PEP-CTERM sorting domain-containing protein [Desulfobulbaceae bacterium]
MRRYATTMALGLTAALLLTGNAFALSYDNNITIYDGSGYTGSGTGGEDRETEPGMVNSQVWDLEAFYQKGNSLTMVGGYNFKTGVTDYPTFTSGDIFIDTNGLYGASQAPSSFSPTTGNTIVASNFGYEYVLDLNFINLTYDVYKLVDTGKVVKTETSYYPQNEIPDNLTDPTSDPWRYVSGGTLVGSGMIDYPAALSDAAVGLFGGIHYAAGVDLSFLDPAQQFVAHFTMGCGNDNLMGSGTTAPVPEPATMLLFGTGISGLAAWQRRKFRKA